MEGAGPVPLTHRVSRNQRLRTAEEQIPEVGAGSPSESGTRYLPSLCKRGLGARVTAGDPAGKNTP